MKKKAQRKIQKHPQLKSITCIETDKPKEKVFGCKLKTNREFSISGQTKNRTQLLYNESHAKSAESYL
jgi:hypothetical protein